MTITPKFVKFHGKPGEPLSASVKIIPEKEFPFTIVKSKAKNGKLIQFQLDGLNENGKKGYLLNVQNLKKDSGVYFDTIILTTDSKIQPEISINIHARIMDPNAKTKQAGKNNPFLKLIQKMQEEKKLKQHDHVTPKVDSVKAEEFKRKFEALIKQDQERKKN